MESHAPYAVAATAAFLASVALLFVYLRRRVGDWVALAAVLPILFMGSCLRGPADAVPDRLLRLDGVRHRRAARDRARRPPRRCDRLRAAGRVARVRGDRARLRRRGRRRRSACSAVRCAAPGSSPCRSCSTPSGTRPSGDPHSGPELRLAPQRRDQPGVRPGRVCEQRRLAVRPRHSAGSSGAAGASMGRPLLVAARAWSRSLGAAQARPAARDGSSSRWRSGSPSGS